MSRRRWFQMFIVTVVTGCLLACTGIVSAQGNSADAFERVKQVQERNTDWLMTLPGVMGTGVGAGQGAQPIVVVLVEHGAVGGIPDQLEGVPVRKFVTGVIEALQKGGKANPRSSQDPANPYRWTHPVPIGVSTGNANEVSAGTIACRVKNTAGNVYALSNNHVYARENRATLGEEVLQPGRYDGGIPSSPDHLGVLSKFVTIVFKPNAMNKVDAAIAATTTNDLGTATPALDFNGRVGYGTPGATPVTAAVGMGVQKFGRTTGQTTGSVYAVNVTVKVSYSRGIARFVGQIAITPGTFSAAGDSGSLIVTQSGNGPVGLLFAGSSTATIANPISEVLKAFGVSIDNSPQ